ncbi:hypothetical protein N0V90_005875 [Kalmusia sp. IMI 367209]|nr:hypothetical protein N0V90_005875 [Kalmusia sp. IMI 367209]
MSLDHPPFPKSNPHTDHGHHLISEAIGALFMSDGKSLDHKLLKIQKCIERYFSDKENQEMIPIVEALVDDILESQMSEDIYGEDRADSVPAEAPTPVHTDTPQGGFPADEQPRIKTEENEQLWRRDEASEQVEAREEDYDEIEVKIEIDDHEIYDDYAEPSSLLPPILKKKPGKPKKRKAPSDQQLSEKKRIKTMMDKYGKISVKKIGKASLSGEKIFMGSQLSPMKEQSTLFEDHTLLDTGSFSGFMAEALLALGVAASIVQLIGFTSSLISKGSEIYKTADGELLEHVEFEAIANHIQSLNSQIAWTPRLHQKGNKLSSSKSEHQLEGLCDSCNEVAWSLLTAIQELKSEGGNKKWDTFQQALRSVWKHDKIQKLTERLERYRRTIDSVLLQILRERIEYLNDLQIQSTEAVQGSLRGIMNQTKLWHAEIMALLQKNNMKLTKTADMSLFSASVSEATYKQREGQARLELLETLQFTGMDDRYERIIDAHRQTFEWMFVRLTDRAGVDRPEIGQDATVSDGYNSHIQWDSFMEWLHEGVPLYWCTGKPGSGKSTLMKFLYNDPRTYEGLSNWLGDHPLIKAGFFFWNSGTKMQMSRMGLLQSLLYQCLEARMDLISDVFPKRWKKHTLFGGDLAPLTWGELTCALRALVDRTDLHFLFFIDGLDEFDEEPSELAEFVLTLSASPNIKLCVASRPWLVFEEAFDKRPRLMLENLTKRDIQLFVTEKLQSSKRFIELQQFQPQAAQNLIYEISSKASGVFLWVFLVVNSLLEGLRDGDSIPELGNRLAFLPSDLELLFRKILDRLDATYFEQASKIFQLVREAYEPPSLLTLAFAEYGQEAAMQASCEPITEQELSFQGDGMKRRLNSRCKGLLEAPNHWLGAYAPVQYLHRTVRDYMKSPDVWDHITSGAADFEPHSALRGSFLLQLKRLEPSPSHVVLDRLWRTVSLGIQHATIDDATTRCQIPYLDEIDRAGSVFANRTLPHPLAGSRGTKWLDNVFFPKARLKNSTNICWTDSTLLAHEECFLVEDWNSMRPTSIPSFVELAFKLHIYPYVEHKLSCGAPLPMPRGTICFLCSATVTSDVEAVRLLLNNGLDLKHSDCVRRTGPWDLLLHGIDSSFLLVSWEKCADLVELYLKHEADPWVTIDDQSIEEIISRTFRHRDSTRTEELIALLEKSRRSKKNNKGKFGKVQHFATKLKRFPFRST